ncbi:hypothetical protein [Paenibacillus xylaniclasticus]|uniref:hypothetical protein n=1 Tax=Paenibacillus xylaniclasticus TaxID=588083 RepID=UPI000FD92227|nr:MULTISPECIES: hypothetical protein [Paenibacillus]GFN33857.1 hypothetical protein PCURB6_41170 [Paenibacillus curdlanolyticus]
MKYYAKLLSQYIDDSGMTLKEISNKLLENGLSVDSSYISKIKTGAKPPASESISRALAKVLNGNPEKLIFASYLDKAPDEVRETFEQLDCMVDETLKSIFLHSSSPQLAAIIDRLRRFEIDQLRPFCVFDQLNLNEIPSGSQTLMLDFLDIILKEELDHKGKLKLIPVIIEFLMNSQKDLYNIRNNHLLRSRPSKSEEDQSDLDYQNELIETAKNLNLSILFLDGEREIVSRAEGRYLKKCLESLRSYKKEEFGE